MSRVVVAIDTLEHAQLVLKSLRSSSNSASRHQSASSSSGGALASMTKFDEVVLQTSAALPDKKKLEQRFESLLLQEPQTRGVPLDKDLDTPYERSPAKEAAMYHSTAPALSSSAYRRSPNNNELDDDGIDFSSDEEDASSRSKTKSKSLEKLERVALNRPSKHSKQKHSKIRMMSRDDDDLRSPVSSTSNNSFYDDQETLLDSDDDGDNEDLFKGFTAPTISQEPLSSTFATSGAGAASHVSTSAAAAASSSSTKSKAPPSSTRSTTGSVFSSLSSTSGHGSISALTQRTHTSLVTKAPSVPPSQTLKDLPKGVVVGKGGIFIRSNAGNRRRQQSE